MTSATGQRLTPSESVNSSGQTRLFSTDPYFVLRTPALPIERWFRCLGAESDPKGFIERLRQEWTRPQLQEALALASPSLHRRLSEWDWSVASKKDRKLLQAAYRYFARMCTRSTPFGLFSSVAVGVEDDEARLDLEGPGERLRRHVRLDTATVARITECLLENPDIRRQLKLRVNDCGYQRGDRWIYVEWISQKDTRDYQLSSVDLDEALHQLLMLAAGNALTVHELVDEYGRLDPDIDRAEVYEFIDLLIESKLLLTSLEPRLTGMECLPAMLETLEAIPEARAAVRQLEQCQRRLTKLDSASSEQALAAYRDVEKDLQPLNLSIDRQQLLQVDFYRDLSELTLPGSIMDELARAAEIGLALGASRNNRLDDFCQRFTARYEGQRVALLEALDEESGVGLEPMAPAESALLNGVAWQLDSTQQRDGVEQLVVEKYLGPDTARRFEIVIDGDDLPPLDTDDRSRVPEAAHMLATLLAKDVEALNRGEFRIWLQGINGPGVANMIGRFCFGSDELAEYVRTSHRRESEARPEAIHAEIVHLPKERMGNLTCRPLLRDHEIPLLGHSGASEANQIDLSDLEIEVVGKEITLWSRRHGRPVIPRMSNAHNFEAGTLGIYRFLCLLQFHGTTAGGFRLPASLAGRTFSPRVRCGRVILSPAQWRIAGERADRLKNGPADGVGARLSELAAELDIPRHVGLIEGDNVLALDLNSAIAPEILLTDLRKRGELRLIELFVGDSDLCAGHSETRFLHELVVPLGRQMSGARERSKVGNDRSTRKRSRQQEAATDWARYLQRADSRSSTLPDRVRHRLPGSDWLSYRLFGGAALLDRALAETLAPAADEWQRQGLCSGWFFIRYNDPGWHLRLRFHGEPAQLLSEVLPRMHRVGEALMADGLVTQLDIASYRREIERYGGPEAIELCERWFAQESARTAALIRRLRGGDPEWRWQIAVLCLTQDMADFGLTGDELQSLFDFVAAGFREEFSMEKQRLASLGQKYRAIGAQIRALCEGRVPSDLPDRELIRSIIFAHRDERRDIACGLRGLDEEGKLWGPLDSLLPSLLHMACNRWFVDTSRANEMVLYDMVRRGLQALRAQGLGPWAPVSEGQRLDDDNPAGSGSTRSPVVT